MPGILPNCSAKAPGGFRDSPAEEGPRVFLPRSSFLPVPQKAGIKTQGWSPVPAGPSRSLPPHPREGGAFAHPPASPAGGALLLLPPRMESPPFTHPGEGALAGLRLRAGWEWAPAPRGQLVTLLQMTMEAFAKPHQALMPDWLDTHTHTWLWQGKSGRQAPGLLPDLISFWNSDTTISLGRPARVTKAAREPNRGRWVWQVHLAWLV